jgi:hypothetical protein
MNEIIKDCIERLIETAGDEYMADLTYKWTKDSNELMAQEKWSDCLRPLYEYADEEDVMDLLVEIKSIAYDELRIEKTYMAVQNRYPHLVSILFGEDITYKQDILTMSDENVEKMLKNCKKLSQWASEVSK